MRTGQSRRDSNREAVQLRSPGSRSAPWVGGRKRDPRTPKGCYCGGADKLAREDGTCEAGASVLVNVICDFHGWTLWQGGLCGRWPRLSRADWPSNSLHREPLHSITPSPLVQRCFAVALHLRRTLCSYVMLQTHLPFEPLAVTRYTPPRDAMHLSILGLQEKYEFGRLK